MKKLLFLIGCLTIASVSYTGCKTPPAVAIVRSEGVIITTVDTGMKTWALYVTQHQHDGKVTQAQVDKVQDVYSTYYNAQLVLKGALEMYVVNGSTNKAEVDAANIAVLNAQSAILALLNQYIK